VLAAGESEPGLLGGPWRPRSLALASGGISCPPLAGVAVETLRAWASPRERSVWPGATDETNAAMPAVSAAAPPTVHRRRRLTRTSAASRSSCATDRLRKATRSGTGTMLTMISNSIMFQ
jgi:hypothetical protein